VAASVVVGASRGGSEKPSTGPALSGKRLGTIFNNDINNIIAASSGGNTTPEEYQRAVYAILDMKPGVLAQNVGMPDPVLYSSTVATTFDKYLEEASTSLSPEEGLPETVRRQVEAMRKLRELGADPFTLTIEACRKRGVAVLASYRMNAEDFYRNTMLMSDFERGHPEWRIPGANCADPLVPEVFAHRMAIFREVAERYDIDGIEFDFRRWYHMVSDPLKNHTVLTRMVRETHEMLDETARKKGRKRLILEARVGPSLDTDPSPFVYPGIYYPDKPTNASCKDLGLDVKTWIAEGLVDALCPALFLDGLPSLPKTREFVALAKKTGVGIYPTLWSWSLWAHGISEHSISLEKKDAQALALYKDELCSTALRMYEDGADGISTFNWYSHLRNARLPHRGADTNGQSGAGMDAVQTYIYPLLKDPAAIRRYREQPWALPPRA
jgi:hypothetical protein